MEEADVDLHFTDGNLNYLYRRGRLVFHYSAADGTKVLASLVGRCDRTCIALLSDEIYLMGQRH